MFGNAGMRYWVYNYLSWCNVCHSTSVLFYIFLQVEKTQRIRTLFGWSGVSSHPSEAKNGRRIWGYRLSDHSALQEDSTYFVWRIGLGPSCILAYIFVVWCIGLGPTRIHAYIWCLQWGRRLLGSVFQSNTHTLSIDGCSGITRLLDATDPSL